MQQTLETLIAGKDLTRQQTRDIFNQIMTGQMPEVVMGAFLGALATKGQTVDEIVGAAEAMQAVTTPIRCSDNCIDTCGTGGDGISTFNTSTTAAIVAAAAGATVAKHGSNTNSRRSGSAEALRSLGVNLDATPGTVEKCIAEVGIGFLYAVKLHPAMKHAAPVRRALGVQTIFNLLGPLTNPAGAKRQVLGVNRKQLVPQIAEALRKLGATRALVVHGGDGLCDMTITTETTIAEVTPDGESVSTVHPSDFGLQAGTIEDLLIESPEQSADIIRRILDGEKSPRRDHVLLNTAAALLVADIAADLQDGINKAAEAIDSGKAQQTLDKLIERSNA